MKTSDAMTEIRNIRNANSKHHLTMTLEERKKEENEVLVWFNKVSKKPLKIVKAPEYYNGPH